MLRTLSFCVAVLLGAFAPTVTTAQSSPPSSAPICGSGPSTARLYVLKRQAIGRGRSTNPATDPFAAVADSFVTTVTEPELCQQILLKIMLVDPQGSERPLVGISRMGDVGFTVVMMSAPVHPGSEGWVHMFQVDHDLVVRQKHEIRLDAFQP